jgi:hypothetical protein
VRSGALSQSQSALASAGQERNISQNYIVLHGDDDAYVLPVTKGGSFFTKSTQHGQHAATDS